MANIELLARTLSYIEDHLNSDIQTEDIAKACYASKSSLEKNFKAAAHFSKLQELKTVVKPYYKSISV